jgi:AcrR family transcriptional regulator
VRNRLRVLSAAQEEFAAEGQSASLDNIARRAGVGAGTVHRHFPAKDELFAAVITDRLARLTRVAHELADADQPGPTFVEFLLRVSSEASQNLALSASLGSAEAVAAVEQSRDALRGALGVLLARAQEAGDIRGDLSADELQAVVIGVVAIERHLPLSSRGRGLALVLDGLRP